MSRAGLQNVSHWMLKPPVARVLGIGTNSDGYTKESVTYPSWEAQAKLARQVRERGRGASRETERGREEGKSYI